jgi:hypothetical protein
MVAVTAAFLATAESADQPRPRPAAGPVPNETGDHMTHDATLTPSQSAPDNVARAAASAGLGALQQTYQPKKRSGLAIMFLLVLGLAMTIILIGFWVLWETFRTPNLSKSQAARRIYMYEQGFVVLDKPDDPQVYRFDAIDTVFQKIVSQRAYGVETSKQFLYTITSRDGRTIKLTQFWANIEQVGPYINERVSMVLLPAALGAIDRGQGVVFGDMTLTAAGISGRRKTATWNDVRKVSVTNGYVSVNIAGKFLSLSTTEASKLPNLPLFFALTDRLIKSAR